MDVNSRTKGVSPYGTLGGPARVARNSGASWKGKPGHRTATLRPPWMTPVVTALAALVLSSTGLPALPPAPGGSAPLHVADGSTRVHTGAAEYPATIYVVRHAERSPEPPDDPHLSEAGRLRATLLSEMLGGQGLAAVLSTDTRRTRETAAPVAVASGAEIHIYDPRDAASLAALLAAPELEGRAVLVVGHSNTVPGIVERLAGVPVEPIADDEYDRLYRLDAVPGGGWQITLLRFGAG